MILFDFDSARVMVAEGKSHYEMLGVSCDESPEGIRRAFRLRAKELHPDCVGEGCEAEFKALAEAYDVLSDPEARASYDRGRRTAPAAAAGWSPPWPWPREVSTTATRPRSPVDLTVELSSVEARLGGVLPLPVPEPVPCPSCGGAALLFGLRCVRCQGHGAVVVDRLWDLLIPAGVEDGATLRVRLGERGPVLRVGVALTGG